MIRHSKAGPSALTKAENSAQVQKTVEAILGDIAARGEAAVREYSEKFDNWSPATFRLSESEIHDCIRSLPQQVIEDIRFETAGRAAGCGSGDDSRRCAGPQEHPRE